MPGQNDAFDDRFPNCHEHTISASIRILRRLLPILLLVAFVLPLFAPLLAFGQSAESGLPACCRRNGKHHCALSMAEKSHLAAHDSAPQWTAPKDRCPYYPASFASGQLHETLAAPSTQAFYAQIVSHPTGVAQTESMRRIASERSRQKRGPPTFQI